MPEAQTLLTVVQGTVLGMPAPKAACLHEELGTVTKPTSKCVRLPCWGLTLVGLQDIAHNNFFDVLGVQIDLLQCACN